MQQHDSQLSRSIILFNFFLNCDKLIRDQNRTARYNAGKIWSISTPFLRRCRVLINHYFKNAFREFRKRVQ